MTGLSVRTIQRLERGETPSLETAKALASVFEVDHLTFHSMGTEELVMQADLSKISISSDAADALRYAKNVKEFCEGVVIWVVLALIFFSVFGFRHPVLYLVFLGAAVGVVLQGLLAFEVVRLPFVNASWCAARVLAPAQPGDHPGNLRATGGSSSLRSSAKSQPRKNGPRSGESYTTIPGDVRDTDGDVSNSLHSSGTSGPLTMAGGVHVSGDRGSWFYRLKHSGAPIGAG